MSNNGTTPGLMQPTVASYPPGAGTPRDAAIINQQQTSAKLASLGKSTGGKRRHRKWIGGESNANTIVVPQFSMPYSSTGGPGQNVNDNVKNLSANGSQNAVWNKDDSAATKMGGSKRRLTKKGGNVKWGCYSGGLKKKYTKRNSNGTKRKLNKTKRKSNRKNRNK
jgi:hypothetical protein